jgi:hypothetical protein
MSDWSLTDTQLLAAAILGIGFIVLIVTAFRKPTVPRKEFARLQEGIKRLSEEVKELQAAGMTSAGEYAPRFTRGCISMSRGSRSASWFLPCQPVYAGYGIPFQLKERAPKEIGADVLEERMNRSFFLSLASCRKHPALTTRFFRFRARRVFADPHFAWRLPLAPSVPQPIARPCSPTFQLLRQSLTSRIGASSG